MSEEIATIDPSADLIVYRPPNVVLEEAQRAAAALKDVLDKKPRKVKFNNEQYLEFEDWTLLGKFYGVTAKVERSTAITVGEVNGFEAVAQVIRLADGAVISSADAMCLQDEPNWERKPLFQLRSMAQTRACAKVLRNVQSWVVVLAGYRPTPAEEMDGVFQGHPDSTPPSPRPVARVAEPGVVQNDDASDGAPPREEPADWVQPSPKLADKVKISAGQAKRFWAIAYSNNWNNAQVSAMLTSFGLRDTADIPRNKYEEVIALLERGPQAAGA